MKTVTLTLAILFLLFIQVFAENATYWVIGPEGDMVQVTEKEHRWEEKKVKIEKFYLPLCFGLAGAFTLTPVGMILVHT